MKKYFYSFGKEKKGPYTFEELKNEEITPETLIWFEGLDDWTTAKYILELEEILQLSPPPINMVVTQTTPESNSDLNTAIIKQIQDKEIPAIKNNWEIESITNIHPWRRFFARTVDLFTIGGIFFALFCYLVAFTFPNNIESFLILLKNPIILPIALYLVYIPIEALLLFLFGTTPAKWIYGIHVKHKTGRNLSYNQTLKRTFQAFVNGEGFAIPIIILITRIRSYRNLKDNGISSWDSNIGSRIYYEKWSIIKIVVSVLVTFLSLFLMSYLNTEI